MLKLFYKRQNTTKRKAFESRQTYLVMPHLQACPVALFLYLFGYVVNEWSVKYRCLHRIKCNILRLLFCLKCSRKPCLSIPYLQEPTSLKALPCVDLSFSYHNNFVLYTYNFAVIAVHCYDESNLFLTENGCLSCAMCLKNKFKKASDSSLSISKFSALYIASK